MGLNVQKTYNHIIKNHRCVQDPKDAQALIKAAEKDNETEAGCCSGPGTSGTDWLRDTYQKKPDHFKNLDVRAVITKAVGLDSRGQSTAKSVEKSNLPWSKEAPKSLDKI